MLPYVFVLAGVIVTIGHLFFTDGLEKQIGTTSGILEIGIGLIIHEIRKFRKDL